MNMSYSSSSYRPVHPANHPNTTGNGYNQNHYTDNDNDYQSFNESQHHHNNSNTTSPTSTLYHRNVPSHATTQLQRQTSSHTPLTRMIRTVRSAVIFYKADSDYTLQHHAGGVISIVAFLIITLLTMNELYTYMDPQHHTHISVETRENMKNHIVCVYILHVIEYFISHPSVVVDSVQYRC
jgi:hypothetical protein